jgi:glycerol-3-phosphate dehydrogenase
VILNALDAKERGATILTRTRCTSLRRVAGRWQAELADTRTGERRSVTARAVVNAAGPWVDDVLASVTGNNAGRRVRLVKGSHIVVRKFWQGPQAYLLQNTDRRVIFVNPYEDDLCLIGTTDIPYDGRPEDVAIDQGEVDYLLGVVNRYFSQVLTPEDIVHRFSGIRPLYDDAALNPSAVTRDYVFDIEPETPAPDRAPLLSVFGGKITTYRKLAEHALAKLAPFFLNLRPAWTAGTPLPGGDLPEADFDAWLAGFRCAFPWLPADLTHHYGRLYGTRANALLDGCTSLPDLGRHFGARLYEREARYLTRHEWARTAEDVLERRTKHGLHLSTGERAAFAAWLTTPPRAARSA